MGVKIEIRGADETVARLQDLAVSINKPLRPLFDQIASEWVTEFQGHFRNQGDSSGAWAALSPATQKRRKKLGYGATSPILQRTGLLLSSISATMTENSLSVGTTQERAALLQFGGSTGSTSALPDRDVPARPFVSLSAEMVEDVMEGIEAYFLPEPEVSASGVPRG